MNYQLTGDDGQIMDESRPGNPLSYLHGHRNIIPGLEAALEGKEMGDALEVKIPPAEAYGEVNPELQQDVPKSNFPNPDEIEIGMKFQAQTQNGPVLVSVVGLSDENVTIDANHPMAGKNLNFKVEITDVRLASEEEVAHGHIHQEGGCCGGNGHGDGECCGGDKDCEKGDDCHRA